MSNPYTGSVASALRKAQLLLDLLVDSAAGSAPAEGLSQAALQEGALLQLWRAYRAFLAEQAHQLGLRAEPESAHGLLKMAETRQNASAEVRELASLAENRESWFSAMERAWHSLWRLSSGPGEAGGHKGVQVQSAVNLIPSTTLAEPAAAALDARGLRQWHRSLSELISRQRAQAQEW